MKKEKLYTVYYFTGGWMNFKRHVISGYYVNEDSNGKIATLNKGGYPAFRIEKGKDKTIGYVEDSSAYTTEGEKKAAWEEIQRNGVPQYKRNRK